MPETETHPLDSRHDNGAPLDFSSRRTFRERVGSNFRAWSRETFSRDSLASSLKSLAWVAPLTVLIWIYAEREQVVTWAGRQVIVTVRSSDPTRVARLVGPDLQPIRDTTIQADLKGPQSGIEKLRDSFGMGGGPPIDIDIDQNTPLGMHPVPTAVINNSPRFKSAGVSVSNVIPAELNVWVDTIIDLPNVDVEPAPDVKNLTGRPIFNPAKVRVSGPKSVLESAMRDGRLHVYAELKGFKELEQPGHHELTGVPLTVTVRDPDVRLARAAISAEVEVSKLDINGTIPYVRIGVTNPLTRDADQWKAVPLDDQGRPITTLANVKVTGPAEIIKLLETDKYEPKPEATFEVTDFSEPDKEKTATLDYKLPEKVQLDPAAPHTIRYRLEARNSAP
jgi:hypothetical protein